MRPIVAAGLGVAAVVEASERLSVPLSEYSDQAVVAIYHAQQANSWMRNILEGFEATLTSLGLHSPTERIPAICFLDITGYTRLAEERGDVAAADLAQRLSRLVQQHSSRYGGTTVKWLGDGVMFHFPEPGNGVLAALDLMEAGVGHGLPPAHVGLHAGPVLLQEGDYFGRTVNVAARITDYARQGEVLVSQEVVDVMGDTPVDFTDIGPVELKGIAGTVRLHIARRGAEATAV